LRILVLDHYSRNEELLAIDTRSRASEESAFQVVFLNFNDLQSGAIAKSCRNVDVFDDHNRATILIVHIHLITAIKSLPLKPVNGEASL
jgi:hypothetical protein